jgi:hypothetical protein
MYWNVPSSVPSAVSARAIVGDCVRVRGGAVAHHAHRARQPEVHELGAAARQHDVRGLEVPVHDARAVRAVERVGDLRPQAKRLGRGHAPAREALLERLALDQLEHEEVDVAFAADVVERADVRVVEARDRPRFAFEAGAHLGLGRQVFGSTLTATSLPRRVSRAR